MSQKYVCAKCGTAVELLYKGGCIPSCCGEPMQLMEAKTEDFVKEKHVPYIEKQDGGFLVKVGKETAHFFKTDAAEVQAWEYCNKHGLWKSNQ